MLPAPLTYLAWHYGYGLPHLFLLIGEFVRFLFNLFSINLFLRTLISPMFNVKMSMSSAEDGTELIPIIASNLVMRVLGLFLRSLFIVCGLTSIVITVLLMLVLIVLWTLLPLMLLLSVYSFITLLIK